MRCLLLLALLILPQGCGEKTCEDSDGSPGAYRACGLDCQGKDKKAECSCSSRCPCWGKK